MKKIFLSLVAAIVAATATYAQSSLVATLSHDGVTTAYYGANAFGAAHSAAVDGDVITLSSGTFHSVWITKNVTIRGAGMKMGTDMQFEATKISGSFDIQIITSTKDCHLTLEGIDFLSIINLNNKPLNYAVFSKCRFANIYRLGVDGIQNALFVNCDIRQLRDCPIATTFRNCIIGYIDVISNCDLSNCIVKGGRWYYSEPFSLTNCICYVSGNNTLPAAISTYNCVAFGEFAKGFFKNINNTTNKSVADSSSLFKTFTGGTYTEEETFELTDEAASTYLGMDGTQVGIYGGDVPFDPTPSNPQITQFDVEKNTANGKLTVKINVE